MKAISPSRVGLAATTPPPTLIYGHGLLRSACDEGCVEPGAAELMPHLTALLGTVTVATEWWGLSQADLPGALSAGANLALLPRITDKLAAGAIMPFHAGRIARLGIPQHLTGLVEVVRNPIHATGVGLLLYGRENYLRGRRPSPLSGNMRGMLDRMKAWFQGSF